MGQNRKVQKIFIEKTERKSTCNIEA
jgi:hypothetical protein